MKNNYRGFLCTMYWVSSRQTHQSRALQNNFKIHKIIRCTPLRETTKCRSKPLSDSQLTGKDCWTYTCSPWTQACRPLQAHSLPLVGKRFHFTFKEQSPKFVTADRDLSDVNFRKHDLKRGYLLRLWVRNSVSNQKVRVLIMISLSYYVIPCMCQLED